MKMTSPLIPGVADMDGRESICFGGLREKGINLFPHRVAFFTRTNCGLGKSRRNQLTAEAPRFEPLFSLSRRYIHKARAYDHCHSAL